MARVLLALTTVASLTFCAPHSQAANGRVEISSKQKLKFKGCGRDKTKPAVELFLTEDGRWAVSSDGVAISGQYVATGRKGRKLELTPDAASAAALLAYLEAELGSLCGTPVTGLVATPTVLRAKINRRETKATLKLAYRLQGVGTGKLRLGGKGSLEPLPPGAQIVGPAGGRLEFPSGATLDVPAGALTKPTAISISAEACDEVDAIVSAPVFSSHEKACLFRFDAQPDGLTFAAPALASFPVRVLDADEVPVWIEVDPELGQYRELAATLEYRGDEGRLDVLINHFSGQTSGVRRSKQEITRSGPELDPCCNESPMQVFPPCCCLFYQSESMEGDFVADDCEVLGSEIKVTFHVCPGTPTFTDMQTETRGECPEDLHMEITPANPRAWVCEDVELEARLVGTRPGPDGGTFAAATPTSWSRSDSDPAMVDLSEGPINTATVRAEDPVMPVIVVKSTADPRFRDSTQIDFRPLEGLWDQRLLTGSETCTMGDESFIEDEGPEEFEIEVTRDGCNYLEVRSPDFPLADRFTGDFCDASDPDPNLVCAGVANQDPSQVFTFDLVTFGPNTVDCYVFFDSNGADIVFGDEPLCLVPTNCRALECDEFENATGTIASAEQGTLSGTTKWHFEATVELTMDEQTAEETVICDGEATFMATKQ